MPKKYNYTMKTGRPLKFKTAETLEKAINIYLKKCASHKEQVLTKAGKLINIKNPLIPTIAGLAVHLGTDRHTIHNYSEKQEFFTTIKKYRDIILSQLENKLANVNGNISGAIFLAKNYGYTDNRELKVDLHHYSDETKKEIEDIVNGIVAD